MTRQYQICIKCIMDTSDPEISFDDRGICNHCQKYEAICVSHWISDPSTRAQALKKVVAEIQSRSSGKEYDCVIGVSGGVDSTYVAYMTKKLGLRPLAVHFDSGWNSELAVKNIENLVKKLSIDLHTFVVDWEEMRDLQLAFFKASVANCDIPTDHAIIATLYRVAGEHGIPTIITGQNYATESILPASWGYTAQDLRHILSIHRKFGKAQLKKYPTLSFFQTYFYYPKMKGIQLVPILNYLDYDKKKAIEVMSSELAWRDYGGKHFESVFTRFFQSYYLPKKFGFDKRRAHLASLVVSGQISREHALETMQTPPHPEHLLLNDKEFVAKKLGLTTSEFDEILALENRDFKDYPSNQALFQLKAKVGRWIRGFKMKTCV